MDDSPEYSATRTDSLIHVVLRRAQRANALNESLVESLIELLQTAEREKISLVVFSGDGRNFCSGFDLGNVESQSDGDFLRKFVRVELLLQRIAHASFHTLALAHGSVVGAGCDLFCACSVRICDSGSMFRMPGWRFGIALGTRRLVHRVGADAARSLLNESRALTAQDAVRLGLATSEAEQHEWQQLISQQAKMAQLLDINSRGLLLSLTSTDTRESDMAALVLSASRPGLKARISEYRASERAKKS